MAAFYSAYSPGGKPSERAWNAKALYLARLDAPSREPLPGKQRIDEIIEGRTGSREDLVPWGLPRQLSVSPPQIRMGFCYPTPFAYAQANVSPEH